MQWRFLLCLSVSLTVPLSFSAALLARPYAHVVRPATDCNGTGVTIFHKGGSFALPTCPIGVQGTLAYSHARGWAPFRQCHGCAGVNVILANVNPLAAQCGAAAGETAIAYLLFKWTIATELIFGKSKLSSSFGGSAFNPGQSYSLAFYDDAQLQWTEPLGNASKQGSLTFPTPLSTIVVKPAGPQDCFEIQTP